MALVAVAEENIGPFFLGSDLLDPEVLDRPQKGEVSEVRAVHATLDELNFAKLGEFLGIKGGA